TCGRFWSPDPWETRLAVLAHVLVFDREPLRAPVGGNQQSHFPGRNVAWRRLGSAFIPNRHLPEHTLTRTKLRSVIGDRKTIRRNGAAAVPYVWTILCERFAAGRHFNPVGALAKVLPGGGDLPGKKRARALQAKRLGKKVGLQFDCAKIGCL